MLKVFAVLVVCSLSTFVKAQDIQKIENCIPSDKICTLLNPLVDLYKSMPRKRMEYRLYQEVQRRVSTETYNQLVELQHLLSDKPYLYSTDEEKKKYNKLIKQLIVEFDVLKNIHI